MKTSPLITVFFFAIIPMSIFAQGSLNPPGAPAPTMKSLDQIEPRTPISSLPVTISTGGGYYLTKSLNIASGDAIIIAVNGVTLDLNGFEITSTEASPAHSGVVINGGLRNIRIMNGAIRGNVTLSGSSFSGTGFANGIQANPGSTANTHVSDVAVSGCLANGINLGNSGLVESCTSSVTGSVGIRADTVIYSNAYQFGIEGINANNNATGCYANSSATTTADGISAGLTAIGCVAFSNATGNDGAIATKVARDCYAVAEGGAGDALLANTAENCNGFAFGTGSGIHCFFSASNCYGTSSGNAAAVNITGGSALNCHGDASGSGIGLSALSAENCSGVGVSGSGIHCSFNASNCYGTSSGSGAAVDVIGGTALNCYGVNSGSGSGLSATTAQNSYGITSANGPGLSAGLSAGSAQNCYGQVLGANGGSGLFAHNAINCYGVSAGSGQLNAALWADRIAQNCLGFSSASGGGGIGVYTSVAMNCSGSAPNPDPTNNPGYAVFPSRIGYFCGITGSGFYP